MLIFRGVHCIYITFILFGTKRHTLENSHPLQVKTGLGMLKDTMLAQGECAEAKRQGEGQKESTREEGEPGLMWFYLAGHSVEPGNSKNLIKRYLRTKVARSLSIRHWAICMGYVKKDLQLTCLDLGT